MLNSCVMHRHTGPSPDIMVWGGMRYHSRTPLVRIASTLTASAISPTCWSQMSFLTFRTWPQPYFNRIMRNHTLHALSKENMLSMVAQRFIQITPPAATTDQLWQRVEATWFAVPQEFIQNRYESMPRRVAAVISINGGYSGY
ncbi:uncharacterized protein TNCV_5116741 [Trichonephila clavipes]|nr:uncharacterized protein TNCV_5116741 [Trichonephila clavipes]